MVQTLLILPLTLALALHGGSCRNHNMNDHQNARLTQGAAADAPRTAGDERRVAAGAWGGPHILLDVTETGARVEFDCAHGTLAEPLILKDGRFDVAGTFVRERGGPIREGQQEKGVPARYKGELDGKRMTLTLSFADTDEETFTLTHGQAPRLVKCK